MGCQWEKREEDFTMKKKRGNYGEDGASGRITRLRLALTGRC